jgi:tetratricopeptide (TPR) repeat protein
LWDKHNKTDEFERIFHEQGWITYQEEAIKFYEEIGLQDNYRENSDQALRYIAVRKYDMAMDIFEKAYEENDPRLANISDNTIYLKMKDNPRYLDLLKKMNLPVD